MKVGDKWRLKPNIRPPAQLHVSEWAFIVGFCACAVSTEIPCVGLKVNAQLPNEARVLCLLLICHPDQCLMCVSSEGSGQIANLRILVLVCKYSPMYYIPKSHVLA